MNSGLQYVQEQAVKAAAQHLQRAEAFAELHFKNSPLKKRMGTGANAVIVQFEYPGFVAVYDPATGKCLARSALGKPKVVRRGFVPSLPDKPARRQAKPTLPAAPAVAIK